MGSVVLGDRAVFERCGLPPHCTPLCLFCGCRRCSPVLEFLLHPKHCIVLEVGKQFATTAMSISLCSSRFAASPACSARDASSSLSFRGPSCTSLAAPARFGRNDRARIHSQRRLMVHAGKKWTKPTSSAVIKEAVIKEPDSATSGASFA